MELAVYDGTSTHCTGCKLWLQTTSPAKDGRTRVVNILALFSYRGSPDRSSIIM